MPGIVIDREAHGVVWHAELERADLLPGRSVLGRIVVTARRDIAARGLLVALVGTEQWRYQSTQTDARGHVTSRVETRREELVREPVEVSGPLTLASGDSRSFEFQQPVPPLGPASFEASVSRLDWLWQAGLDIPNGLDSRIESAVHVHQPTALLRAGVIDLGAFALYPSSDAASGDVRASLALDPMPICLGSRVTGSLQVESPRTIRVQEARLELRVHVRATVPSGLDETITVWTCQVTGPGELSAGTSSLTVDDVLPEQWLPTVELPHGRSEATVHLILARAWARDLHLVRDVAICSTTEL